MDLKSGEIVEKKKASTHYDRFLHGLRWSVERGAMEGPPRVDASTLQLTLAALDQDKELEEFVAFMPGFFDSDASPNSTSAMLSLMSDQSTPEPILGSRLNELLKTCLPGASPLTEDERKSRLRVCLRSLWYCLRAFNLPEYLGIPLPPYVRTIFASPQVIRWIQTEQDLAVRLLGRCFGSLVVKKLANDITSRCSLPPTTEESACLSLILGATDEQVGGWLDHTGAIDLANITDLASGELEALIDSGTEGVPADVMDVFQQTFSILAKGMFSSQTNVEWDRDQVAHFQETYSRFANTPVSDVLKERLKDMSDKLPPAS